MKVAIFSTKSYDRQFFTAANAQHQHQLTFLEPKLDRDTLAALASDRVSLIALRCAGYILSTASS